jgi:hypothetical protein
MVFGLTRSGLEPTTYITRSERSNHYSPDTFIFLFFILICYGIIVNIYTIYLKEEFEDAKSVNRRKTGKTMAQRIKEQTTIYKTLHRKLNVA